MTTQPKIELRAIQTIARMSEETHCFSADLIVDGVKWGSIGNEGHGGPDHFHGVGGRNYADIGELNKRIAATYPKIDCSDMGMPGHTLDQSLEILCGNIVNDFLVAKEVKRLLKGKALYFPAGMPEGGKHAPLYQIAFKTWAPEKIIAHVRAKNPAAVILNELPLDQAIAAYRKAA